MHIRGLAIRQDYAQACLLTLAESTAAVQELSCVDLSLDVSERALEVVRAQIEDAARQAKEEASFSLLRELEEEEAAKKVRIVWKACYLLRQAWCCTYTPCCC